MLSVSRDPQLTDLALRTAVTQCQWNCVTQMVKLDVLTTEQREFVCNEAVPRGHFNCAVELLRQGVSPGHSQWIVVEAFRRGKWQLIVDRLRQDFQLSSEVKKLVFSVAVEFRRWDAYLQILESQQASDQDLSTAISVAVCTNHDFLQKVIRGTRNGLRVFKQLCHKQKWSAPTAVNLCVKLCEQERDLALYLAATQGLWSYATQLYADDLVSKKSRRFALRRALRQGAWECAIEMADKSVSKCDERRMVFLEIIRRGHWRLALTLVNKGLSLKRNDAKFAVRICHFLGQLDGVVELCKRCGSDKVGMSLMKCAIQRTIETGSAELFMEFFYVCGGAEFLSLPTLKLLITKAVALNKADILLMLISHSDGYFFYYMRNDAETIAIEKMIKMRKWNLMKRISSSRSLFFSASNCLLMIKTISNTQKVWKTCVPILEKWFESQEEYEIDKVVSSDAGSLLNISVLARWCCKRSFLNTSLMLSLISRNWPLVDDLVTTHAGSIDNDLLVSCFNLTMANRPDIAASFLQHLDYHELQFDIFSHPMFDTFREKCREKGLIQRLIEFSIDCHEWDVVEEELQTVQNQSLIDYATKEAASIGHWSLVTELLDRCSQDGDCLGEVFRSTVEYGNIACAESLISKVDLPCIPGSHMILFEAVSSLDNREEMVRLCISAGISTLQRSEKNGYFSPVRRALQDGQMPLVRLLHESGSCSNNELHRLRKDAGIRAHLERQHRKDILLYLEQVAGNPGSL